MTDLLINIKHVSFPRKQLRLRGMITCLEKEINERLSIAGINVTGDFQLCISFEVTVATALQLTIYYNIVIRSVK